jgi:ribulose-phosphate 3-epimerase
MPAMLAKARQIKPRLRKEQRLEIDGGINADTITQAAAAGVDWFVVASAIFDKPDRAAAIGELRGRLKGTSSR